jgi:hypothetical protein
VNEERGFRYRPAFSRSAGYGAASFTQLRFVKDGGAKEGRTPDLLNAIQTLYQLSYDPIPETDD